jgi:hypothetical protein
MKRGVTKSPLPSRLSPKISMHLSEPKLSAEEFRSIFRNRNYQRKNSGASFGTETINGRIPEHLSEPKLLTEEFRSIFWNRNYQRKNSEASFGTGTINGRIPKQLSEPKLSSWKPLSILFGELSVSVLP